MQMELDAEYPELEIAILGVNDVDKAEGNELMCDGRDLPWLQDTEEADWWGIWAPTYRDVIILDEQGELAAVFNLTEKPITDDEYYLELEALFIELAGG